jgi:hypothetical protein
MDADSRDKLPAVAEEDRRARAELAAGGSLFGGFHPAMQVAHARNAARLAEIRDRLGWLGRGLAGMRGRSTPVSGPVAAAALPSTSPFASRSSVARNLPPASLFSTAR